MQQTVFVVGAGASSEANLPVGAELKETIADKVDIRFDFMRLKSGDPLITEALRRQSQSDKSQNAMEKYQKACWRIAAALPQAMSIDNYVDAHKNDPDVAFCAKLAISRCILDAERESSLSCNAEKADYKLDFHALSKTWYNKFFQLLVQDCSVDDLVRRLQRITLIIFNYDRCIEHFLLCSLMNYYAINVADAARLIENLNIYHPYGVAGSLPWMNQPVPINFGDAPNVEQLLSLASRIKTFSEGVNPRTSEVKAIRSAMGEASRIVFLGFAFHKMNLKLLTPSEGLVTFMDRAECYATTYGISKSDGNVVLNWIENMFGKELEFFSVPKTCSEFFDEYSRSLAFE